MIDQSWTLFLDRDGIVNERIVDDYVKSPEQFIFKDDFLASIKTLRSLFGRIIIVTNQQGIGKGIMAKTMLSDIHDFLLDFLKKEKIELDNIYVCPHLASEKCICRKPETGMADQAKCDFPEIDFKKSIMVGDSLSDILFGKRKGMITVYINNCPPHPETGSEMMPDFYYPDLLQFTTSLKEL